MIHSPHIIFHIFKSIVCVFVRVEGWLGFVAMVRIRSWVMRSVRDKDRDRHTRMCVFGVCVCVCHTHGCVCVGVVFYMLCSDNRNMHSIGQVRTLVEVRTHDVCQSQHTNTRTCVCVWPWWCTYISCVFSHSCVCACVCLYVHMEGGLVCLKCWHYLCC